MAEDDQLHALNAHVASFPSEIERTSPAPGFKGVIVCGGVGYFFVGGLIAFGEYFVTECDQSVL